MIAKTARRETNTWEEWRNISDAHCKLATEAYLRQHRKGLYFRARVRWRSEELEERRI